MNPNHLFVAQRARYQCEYCRAPEVISNIAFEVDHIIPLSKNGLDVEQNWALSCRVCNLRKLAHIDGFDSVTQQQIRLFNPRIDDWNEHFAIQREVPFLLAGKTSIGRATLERLEMNSPLQVRARELWIALGIF